MSQAQPPFETMPLHSQVLKVPKPHDTWLHLDKEANPQRQANASLSSSESTCIPGNIMSHTSQSSDRRGRVLLMTCQVRVMASEGCTTIARALLYLASSTSFVTKHLAQRLHLRRQYRQVQISSIDGITTHSGSHRVVNFKVILPLVMAGSWQWKQWSFLK